MWLVACSGAVGEPSADEAVGARDGSTASPTGSSAADEAAPDAGERLTDGGASTGDAAADARDAADVADAGDGGPAVDTPWLVQCYEGAGNPRVSKMDGYCDSLDEQVVGGVRYEGLRPHCAPGVCRDFDYSLSPETAFPTQAGGSYLGGQVGHCRVPDVGFPLAVALLRGSPLPPLPGEVAVQP